MFSIKKAKLIDNIGKGQRAKGKGQRAKNILINFI
jgi:hypothetical protein